MTDQQETKGLTTFDIEPAPPPEPPLASAHAAPIALDSFAHGIDPLDGLVVFALADGDVYGSWVRGDAGFTADEIASTMREAYRTALQASRRLAFSPGGDRGPASEPLLTIETPSRAAVLKRVRAFVIATLFDGSIPLGMARLCAARITTALEPELPLTELERLTLPPAPNVLAPPAVRPPAPAAAPSRRSVLPLKAPHATPAEAERARRLIAYAEANLPDAHTVRLRLSLRAHTSRLSLDHPEALPSETILRIETAVLEMLGIERDQLTAVLSETVPP